MTESQATTLVPGLSSAEAAARLRQFGENSLTRRRPFQPLVAFVAKFNSPLILILVGASIISFFVGERTNAVILVAMVMVSVVLDFVNTYRSEKAVTALSAQVVTPINVVRDNHVRSLNPREIVPGDIVQLSAGDVVPADARVEEARDFFLNLSTLTGESLPEERSASTAKPSEFRADQPDAVPMGTGVVTGYATVRVVATGARTLFGAIAERLAKSEPPTDFEKTIRSFSGFIVRVTAVLVIIVFLVNTLLGRGLLESFLFAVAIAIGLTPELLPVIVSVSLSRGAVRMGRKGVIVKHLPAIQNFGRMDVLCTDKTGTLTENRITVVRYVDIQGRVSDSVLKAAYLNSVFHTRITSPLDGAIRTYKKIATEGVSKVDEIPFNFERRRESIVVAEHSKRRLITSGAPETVLPICHAYRDADGERAMDPHLSTAANKQFTALSQEGFKVLAVADRTVPTKPDAYNADEEKEMTLLGYVAFIDPPKKTAGRAIAELEELGIAVKILTGDAAILTQRIAKEVGIPSLGTVTGDELRAMDPAKRKATVERASLFARITPEQKEEIISDLRANGHVVGYLGDGINDAPALKAADVGVSVNNAVTVAKEVADLILLKKSLRVLRDGVVEGRRTFRNTLKYLLMVLSSNFGNMFSMTIASGLLPFLPMLPTQILLNNFLYDSSQLTLSSDAVDAEELRHPTIWNLAFLQRFMFIFGTLSSVFDLLTFGALLWLFHASQIRFQTSWFVESLATQVLVIFIIRSRQSVFRSFPSALVAVNALGVFVVAWLLPYLPFTRDWFHLEPLPLGIVGALLVIITLYLVTTEFAKRLFYRRMGSTDYGTVRTRPSS